MTRNTLKLMACVAILSLGTAKFNDANAQTSATINSNITVQNAIDLQGATDVEWGTWVLVPDPDASDDATIEMDASDNSITITNAVDAVIVQAGTPTAGQFTVQTPAVASVDIYGSVTTTYSTAGATGLTYSQVTFSYNGGSDTDLGATSGAANTISTTAGVDTIDIGGELTLAGGATTPTDGSYAAVVTLNATY